MHWAKSYGDCDRVQVTQLNLGAQSTLAMTERLIKHRMLGRTRGAMPGEIVATAGSLGASDTRYTTGSEPVVDGGYTEIGSTLRIYELQAYFV